MSSSPEASPPSGKAHPDGATPPPGQVLFLCTGNYYRSRFAEILFNHHAEKLALPWRAVSRGLALEFGVNNVGPLSVHTVGRLRELGIPHEDYLRPPRQVSAEDLARAELVVALKEAEHRPLLRERYPAWVERIAYWHVHDLDGATPADALPCLEREVLSLVSHLLASQPSAR